MGENVGVMVGACVGVCVGEMDGVIVGKCVGILIGILIGIMVGKILGASVGFHETCIYDLVAFGQLIPIFILVVYVYISNQNWYLYILDKFFCQHI